MENTKTPELFKKEADYLLLSEVEFIAVCIHLHKVMSGEIEDTFHASRSYFAELTRDYGYKI